MSATRPVLRPSKRWLQDRQQHPEKYLGEDSLFEEFFLLSKGS